MTSQDYKELCIDIYKHFQGMLHLFYKNKYDVIAYSLQIYLSTKTEEIQYDISEDTVKVSPKILIPSYISEPPKRNYFGTFDSECCDALYYYKCNDAMMYFAFKFDGKNKPEVIKTLTRVYIENIIKPLSKFLGQPDKYCYFPYSFWEDFDEESIIVKSIAEYFAFFYCIDIYYIQLLSTQKYESETLIGKLYIPQRGTERSKRDLTIKLTKKVYLKDNIRQIRKLMEIASSELSLVLGRKNMLIGYATKKKDFECAIYINGHLNIDIFVSDCQLIYKNGVFRIADSKQFQYPSLPSTLAINGEQKTYLEDIMKEAYKQKHGTILIVGNKNDVESEVNRLCALGRGISICPLNLNFHLNEIKNITSIDGAVFIDTNCICYGFGIILDGIAIARGNPARGARYNSAVNYVENQKNNNKVFISAIFSEDGTWEYY